MILKQRNLAKIKNVVLSKIKLNAGWLNANQKKNLFPCNNAVNNTILRQTDQNIFFLL